MGVFDEWLSPQQQAAWGSAIANGLMAPRGQAFQGFAGGFGAGLQNFQQNEMQQQLMALRQAEFDMRKSEMERERADKDAQRKQFEGLFGGGDFNPVGATGPAPPPAHALLGGDPAKLAMFRAMGAERGLPALGNSVLRREETADERAYQDRVRADTQRFQAGEHAADRAQRERIAGMPREHKVSDVSRMLVEAGIDPRSEEGRAILLKRAMGSGGMSLETTPDGIRFTTDSNNAPWQKTTLNKIEEKQLNTVDMLGRLKGISGSFDPKYLELGTRLGNAWTAGKEKLGFRPTGSDVQELTAYTNFRRQAVNNLNMTLRELSGAAVTPQEAERLKADAPNPGTGIMDGDSPTEFKAKLDSTASNAKRALIRYNYARAKGIDPLKSGIELVDVDKLIDRRGAELEAALRQQSPSADPQMIRAEVRARLASEFGLD